MRKMMQKEITHTTVKVAKMIVEEGFPKAVPMEDEILIGNVSQETAQRLMGKKYPDEKVTVFGVEPNTQKYELPVEKFLEIATPVIENTEE